MTDFLIIFLKKIIYINLNLILLTGLAFLILRILRIKNPSIKYTLWGMLLLRFLYDLRFYNPDPIILNNLPEHGILTIGLGSGLRTICASLWDFNGIEFTSGNLISILLGFKISIYISFFILLFGIYFLIRNIVNYFLFKRKLINTYVPKKFTDKINIRISDHVQSPFVFGIINPVIVLPVSLNCYCTDSEIKAVIEHEHNHIRRRDHIIFPFLYLLKSVFIFIFPLSIIVRKLIDAEEQICDKLIVQKGVKKKIVAQAILKIIEIQSQIKN